LGLRLFWGEVVMIFSTYYKKTFKKNTQKHVFHLEFFCCVI